MHIDDDNDKQILFKLLFWIGLAMQFWRSIVFSTSFNVDKKKYRQEVQSCFGFLFELNSFVKIVLKLK